MPTKAATARRNLSVLQDAIMRAEAHAEENKMRYRLHCENGAYNIRAGRLALIEEIREAKPFMIERLPFREQTSEKVPARILMQAVEVDA